MNQEEGQDEDQQPNWLGNFEAECHDELNSEPNMEERLHSERELAIQHLWLMFQNSATAIAQLYKDRHQGLSLWLPFQNAALSVTNFYKDSVDRLQHCVDLGQQCGRYSRTRDIVAWVRKKRRHIRREELLAFLCGKNPPPPRNRLGGPSGRQYACVGLDRSLPRHAHSHSQRAQNTDAEDLDAFREALTLQGLNGAMSNISVGYHGAAAQPVGTVSRPNIDDLNHFIHEEFVRNHDSRKRSTSSPDLMIDSPSRKRSRLI